MCEFKIKFSIEGDCPMASVSATFTVTVQPSAGNPLTLHPMGGNLPDETQGIAVSGDPVTTIQGGTPPYSIAVDQGTLPPGMQLTTGVPRPDGSVDVFIEGTPAQSGAFSFQLTVTDSGPATGSKASASKTVSVK